MELQGFLLGLFYSSSSYGADQGARVRLLPAARCGLSNDTFEDWYSDPGVSCEPRAPL